MSTSSLDSKRKELEDLKEEYNAAVTELGQTLDEVLRVRVRRKMTNLEQQIQRAQREVDELQDFTAHSNVDKPGFHTVANTLQEKDWQMLLRNMMRGKCTPFIGCGVSPNARSFKASLAQTLAQEHHCVLVDPSDLAQVCQYLAVEKYWLFPKEEFLEHSAQRLQPDFDDPDEPHNILAGLPLPIYVTTNYDDYMTQALRGKRKEPISWLCRWNEYVGGQISYVEGYELDPTGDSPIVFHMHGLYRVRQSDLPESLVLTEDDYLDFLVSVSKNPDLFPLRIQRAFTETSLLFLGYRIRDWDFRVLMRSLASYLKRSLRKPHVAVQLAPDSDGVAEAEQTKAQAYLGHYFGGFDISVYWGTCREFTCELRQRWEGFHHGS